MDLIFFDTCAIRFLVKSGYTGSEIRDLLSKKGSLAVIGRHTLFECARHYKNSAECAATHIFIEELHPEYTLTRDEFYKAEERTIKYGASFSYWCSAEEKKIIRKSNQQLISGDYTKELTQYIHAREEEIRQAISVWQPIYKLEIASVLSSSTVGLLSLYTISLCLQQGSLSCIAIGAEGKIQDIPMTLLNLPFYDEIVAKLKRGDKLLDRHEQVIYELCAKHGCYGVPSKKLAELKKLSFNERVLRVLEHDETFFIVSDLFKRSKLTLTDDEIRDFMKAPNKSPALYTLVRASIWLADHRLKNRTLPNEDKITDAIQLTEASHCTTFLSAEKDLVVFKEKKEDPFGRKLNPAIELLYIHDFLGLL